MALAAVGGFTLAALDQVKKVKAQGEKYLILEQSNTANQATEHQANVTHGATLYIHNEAEDGHGVEAYTRGVGLFGHSDSWIAVQGNSISGIGVQGNAETGCGVMGSSNSPDGAGVYGTANATSGWARGVLGSTNSTEGAGVDGHASASTGNACGVFGRSESPDGTGVEGHANALGVSGWADSPNGIGVGGHSFGTGVVGSALAASAIPMVAEGAADQTANLQEWRDDSGIPLAVIDKDGNLGLGSLRIKVDGNDFVFYNHTTKIAILDSKGNLHIKGKVDEKSKVL
jgi:hypothetical protein